MLVAAFAAALACGSQRRAAGAEGPDFALSATFSETMITLRWAPISGACAYNVYADYGKGQVLANPIPISSRTRYSFLWVEEDGVKRRVVKGNRVALCVAALEGEGCPRAPSNCSERSRSDAVTTRYFEGFSNIVSKRRCMPILQPAQAVSPVLEEAERIGRSDFLKTYPACANRVMAVYRERVDPHDEGACVPFSTIVSKYFWAKGIPCYRAQGQFISAFHSFNIVVVDSVEYILDFTADQFLPSSSPVLIPRDYCFIDTAGAPTNAPGGRRTAMYVTERIFSPDQVRFTDTRQAEEYRSVLDSLLAH